LITVTAGAPPSASPVSSLHPPRANDSKINESRAVADLHCRLFVSTGSPWLFIGHLRAAAQQYTTGYGNSSVM
jgi:hypothetical protein